MELLRVTKSSKFGINVPSKVVEDPREYSALAEEMTAWLDERNGKFAGNYPSAFAIAHCQVAEDPIQLFVVAKELHGGKETQKATNTNWFFPARAIFNMEIIEKPANVKKNVPVKTAHTDKVETSMEEHELPNVYEVKEACMSFPTRQDKYVRRFFRIKVRYQYLKKRAVLGGYKVETVEEWVEGLKAHVIQHETDHFKAKKIYGN